VLSAPKLHSPQLECRNAKDSWEWKLGVRASIHPGRLKHGEETVSDGQRLWRRIRFGDIKEHGFSACMGSKAFEQAVGALFSFGEERPDFETCSKGRITP
jgi:hypothetical protein